MSWSVSAIGKPGAVAKKLAEDFARITYCGPAETIVKDHIAAAVAEAMGAMLVACENALVEVYASGSESAGVHTVQLKVEPKYGFVE